MDPKIDSSSLSQLNLCRKKQFNVFLWKAFLLENWEDVEGLKKNNCQ